MGGSPLLGVNGICIKAHGNSSPRALKNALRVARESIKHQINPIISAEMTRHREFRSKIGFPDPLSPAPAAEARYLGPLLAHASLVSFAEKPTFQVPELTFPAESSPTLSWSVWWTPATSGSPPGRGSRNGRMAAEDEFSSDMGAKGRSRRLAPGPRQGDRGRSDHCRHLHAGHHFPIHTRVTFRRRLAPARRRLSTCRPPAQDSSMA